ncbi:hypothetical protein GGQ87_000362 [Brevundimonas alba]|uniref:Uncharacterized protein n=1 Tax=Brevundimonas alba TaxID=74314 RepID=A0A7X5YK19_9CAUL|nr:hypothetical protein [Brevundimonas alba]NJC40104.1 hypothetical protein [Brevundimonas alba]
MIARFIVAGLLAFGLQGFTAQERLPSPTPEQIERARIHADQMIAASDRPNAFSNVTDGRSGSVVHIRSNLLCLLDPDDSRAFIELMDEADDVVGCGTSIDEQEMFSLAYRLPRPATIREILDGFSQTVVRGYPGATRETYFARTGLEGLEPAEGARFNATKDGRDVSSIVMASQRDGWAYITVVSGPAQTADMRSWQMTMAQIRHVLIQDHMRSQAP